MRAVLSNTRDMLTRYWFEFASQKLPEQGLSLVCWPPAACGVTAYDYLDAVKLIFYLVSRDGGIPTIRQVSTDVDVSQLPEFVRKYTGCPAWRGVWYPNLSANGPYMGSLPSHINDLLSMTMLTSAGTLFPPPTPKESDEANLQKPKQ